MVVVCHVVFHSYFSITYMRRMDFPIFIIWMSPFSLQGHQELFFIFISFFANRIAPAGTPHLGLICLHMSRNKDAKLIWVNMTCVLELVIFTKAESRVSLGLIKPG